MGFRSAAWVAGLGLGLAAIVATGTARAEEAMPPTVKPGAKVERLAGGFEFTEGPAADAEGNVYFSDIPREMILVWRTNDTLDTFTKDSGSSNGLFFDKEGNIVACQHGRRQVARIDPSGKETTVVATYGGKKLNSPNDLWIDPKGGIYFTDPRYGDTGNVEQNGMHVYYLPPGKEEAIRVIDDMTRPNGIIGTADGKLLYVADPDERKLYRYSIAEDGTLKDKKLFVEDFCDGMTLDAEGNLYITSKGVEVFAPSGEKIGSIPVLEKPANVSFGGQDNDELFITARTSLYRLPMNVKGQATQVTK